MEHLLNKKTDHGSSVTEVRRRGRPRKIAQGVRSPEICAVDLETRIDVLFSSTTGRYRFTVFIDKTDEDLKIKFGPVFFGKKEIQLKTAIQRLGTKKIMNQIAKALKKLKHLKKGQPIFFELALLAL